MVKPNKWFQVTLQSAARFEVPSATCGRSGAPLTVNVGRLRVCFAGGIIWLMIDWSTCPAVERDPERVSGAWVFRGTRVPVAALFENLEDGALVSQFVEWFPGVTMEQVRAVLEHAARSALAPA